jgi:ribonuclease HI
MKAPQNPDPLVPRYAVFVDGSPGPKVKPGFSGWGLALMAGDTAVFQACGTTVERCTSQAIELEAVIQGLAYIHRSYSGFIDLYSDSRYTADSIARLPEYSQAGWVNYKLKPIANADRLQTLWDYLFNLRLRERVTLRWDKGHAGVVGNELADKLSKKASGEGTNWYDGVDQSGG